MLVEDISTRCSYYATGVPTRVTFTTVRHATSVTSREINRGHTCPGGSRFQFATEEFVYAREHAAASSNLTSPFDNEHGLRPIGPRRSFGDRLATTVCRFCIIIYAGNRQRLGFERPRSCVFLS